MTARGRGRRRAHFWSVPVATEVDEEIAAHIELQTRRFIDSGLSETEARALALQRFGDIAPVRAACTDIRYHMETEMRRAEFTEELRQDLRFALRTLRKSPLFTLVALLTIALGVGANTAIFSVVNAVLLRSLPYPNADRTLVLFNSYNETGLATAAVSAPEFFDFREQLRSFDQMAAIRPRAVPISADGTEPEQLSAYVVTPNLFSLLGVRPFIGQDFAATDGAAGGRLVAILSHGLWTRRFGADPSIIGRTISLAGQSRTVVGVMPPSIRFPDDPVGYAAAPADVWIPTDLEQARAPQNRGNQNLVIVGQLRPGISRPQLDGDVAALQQRFRAAFPDRYAGTSAKNWHVLAVPLRDQMVGEVRPTLLLISAAVALVLLIACVNVANLLLARGALRQREMAVRLALGANRGRVMRQLLTESLILSLIGGVVGIGIAWLGMRALLVVAPSTIPRLHETRLDITVLAFSLGVSLLTGLLVGLVPAMQQSRADLRSALSEGARGASDGASRRRLRTTLVVVEVAMALVILNSAGLLVRSFAALQNVDPGFRPAGTLSMYMSLPRAKYDSAAKIVSFYSQLQTAARALPGVTAASGVYPLPMGGEGWSGSFDIEGRATGELEGPHADFAAALPGYFTSMGIPVVQGRDFTADDNVSAQPVAIIDESLARKYWPGQSAIGKHINATERQGIWETVIGVVKHVHNRSPQDEGAPQLYISYLQHPQGMITIVARTAMNPASLTTDLRASVRTLDRDLAVSDVRTLDEVVRRATARPRFNMLMIVVFGLAALCLASIGLYGVMSYLVAQRTREIGIRVALGGAPGDVRRLVIRESLGIAVGGVVLGIAATVGMAGALSRLLFGISATDPLTYAAIATLVLVVASLAAYGPARRATRIDPLVALRD